MYNNLLLGELPEFGKSSGLEMRTDFRESVKFELLMQDAEISEEDKIMLTLNLYFYDPETISDIERAIEDVLWFYRCGKPLKKSEGSKNEDIEEKQKRIYSYEFDDDYIYSAFMEQYGIDLNSIEYLHWWKFRALFNSLNEDTQFARIMGYRSTNLAKIKDKETKAMYKRMKKIYALPDMRSDEEKEADFANQLW